MLSLRCILVAIEGSPSTPPLLLQSSSRPTPPKSVKMDAVWALGYFFILFVSSFLAVTCSFSTLAKKGPFVVDWIFNLVSKRFTMVA